MDEAEDKKEDFDEGGEEKATVDVIKPVPEPEDRAAEAEAKGQRRSSVVITVPLERNLNVMFSYFQSVPACALAKSLSPRQR